MKKLIYLALLCASGMLILLTTVPAQAQQMQTAQEDGIGLDIKLKGIDGRIYDISAMRGNVLLVSFGATWCRPCRDELRVLEELKKEYRDKPVKFLWVDIEKREEMPDKLLQKFARELHLTFPVLRDPTKFIFAQFSDRVRVPMVILLDKNGSWSAPRHVGMATPDLYRSTMRAHLNKLLVATPTGSRARTVSTR